jgi:hypothetical protein
VCDWWRTQQPRSGIPASVVVYLRLTCRTLSELEQLAATHLTLRAPLAPAGVAGAVSSPSRWRRVRAVSYLHRPEQLPTLMLFAAVWPNLRQLHISKPQYLQLLHNTAAAAVFGAGAAGTATAADGLTRSPSKQLLQLQTDWADWLAGPVAAAAHGSSFAPLLNMGGAALGAALAATAAATAAAASSGAAEALPQLQAALAAAAAAVVQLTTGSITSLCSGSSTSSSSSCDDNGSSQLRSAMASTNNDVSSSSSSSSSLHGRMAFAGTSSAAAATSNTPTYGPDGPALHLVAGIVLSGCHWPQLQSLSLSRLGLTPAAAQLLAQAAAQWPLLRLLNASHNKLGAAGLQSLLQAAASHWHDLEVLDVRCDKGPGLQQHGLADDQQQQQHLGLPPAVAAAAAAAVELCCQPWIGASSSSSSSSSKECVLISAHAGKPSELQGMLLDAATGSSSMHWLGPLGACSTGVSSSRRRVQPLHLLVL